MTGNEIEEAMECARDHDRLWGEYGEEGRADFRNVVHCPVCEEQAYFAVSFDADRPPMGGKFKLTACFGGGKMFIHDAPMKWDRSSEIVAEWGSQNVDMSRNYDGYMAEEVSSFD